MTSSKTHESVDLKREERNKWFGNFVHLIKTDQQFLNLGIASQDTENLYDKLIFGDIDSLMADSRDKTTRYYVGKLIVDYIKTLKDLKVQPLNIYLDYNNSQVLVWAQINDNDESTEMSLFKAEGMANAKNFENGFHISSTILEKSDNVQIPPHYQKLEIHA